MRRAEPLHRAGRIRPGGGFTLVELLVVIGIIAVLISVLLPALGAARRQAQAVRCAAHLREIGNCFKMYEIESKGFWPVARINGWRTATGVSSYNIDGVSYPTATPASGQAYWFTFLAKYATKNKLGNAAGTDATQGLLSRQTVFFGCPAWEGYKRGGVNNGDTNIVQVGYGMNPYPTFTSSYPTTTEFPPSLAANRRKEYAVHDIADTSGGLPGNFLKATTWTRPAERMLIADSKFWLASANRPPAAGPYPPAVTAQPVPSNVAGEAATNVQFAAGTTVIDIYRHGKSPGIVNSYYFNPRGGKIAFNILYCDGHVATSTEGREAYRAQRMKFPG